MKILMIGNGFDLEHELPTKYTQFLEFVTRFKYAYLSANSVPKRLYDMLFLRLLLNIFSLFHTRSNPSSTFSCVSRITLST
jgi:hypothetical protein